MTPTAQAIKGHTDRLGFVKIKNFGASNDTIPGLRRPCMKKYW